MSKVLVVGGGASGMVASIYAARGGNEVILIDKNNNLGKKILMTGNGKCNYWNKDIDISHYNTSDTNILEKIITDGNKLEIENFFDGLGIVSKTRDNYCYPASGQATSIQTSLILECQLQGVNIINNCDVLSVTKNINKFEVRTTNDIFIVDKVILATGSKACPKTGSNGFGYQVAKHFGHTLVEPLPALVQLKLDAPFLKEWQGIRIDAKVSLYENKKLVKEEIGEVQLTDYGISGICVFQLSSRIARVLYNKCSEKIEINFLDNLGIKDEYSFIKYFDKRNEKVLGRTISQLLDGILNYKLINLILKISMIGRDEYWDKLDDKSKIRLGINLTRLSLVVSGTNSFDNAQVCSGGVRLSEINPYTMESFKESGLYIIGELLDVDGECGGFNLGFAWITGFLAGKGVNNG